MAANQHRDELPVKAGGSASGEEPFGGPSGREEPAEEAWMPPRLRLEEVGGNGCADGPE